MLKIHGKISFRRLDKKIIQIKSTINGEWLGNTHQETDNDQEK